MHMLNFYLYGRVNARRDGQSEHLQCSKTGVKKKIKKNRSLLIAPRATPRGDPGIFADDLFLFIRQSLRDR